MASVVFECPQCQGAMEAEHEGLRGRLVSCPHCQAQVQLPDADEAVSEELVEEEVAVEEAPQEQVKSSGGQLATGTVIRGIYKIERLLGNSSLGEVYVGSITTDGRQVQLEIIDGNEQETIDRLSREIELLASLDHPNIVRAFDAGQDQDSNIFFLASEYEEGDTLRNMLNQGILGEGDAISCIVDICNGLDYAWESRKIIHRDVKPDNIFITNSGKAKLMGFGIAKSGEGQSMGLTGIGFTIGTPEYMSPEQIKAEGGLDFHTDMYSLGCVLYQTITGRLPFDETAPILLMQKHMDEDPVPANEVNPEISQGCTNAIAAMMAKDPEERPENWEILVNFLKEVKAGGGAAPQTQEVDSGGEEASSGKKGKFGCGGMLAFAACAVVGLGTVLYSILC